MLTRLALLAALVTAVLSSLQPAQAAYNYDIVGACETTATTGTGASINLDGAYTSGGVNYNTFGSQLSTGDTTEYTIQSGDGNIEHGRGTYTTGSPNTFSRDTVRYGSSGTSRISLTGTSIICATWGPGTFLDGVSTIDVTGIDLGNTDTTLTRQAAGRLGVEGTVVNTYTYNSTAPSSPQVGDLWVDSTTGIMYIYTYDGNTYQWVTLQGLLSWDISTLTIDSSPDETADYVPEYDTSASAQKRVLMKHIGAGTQTIWVPGNAVKPRVTNGCATSTYESTTYNNTYGTCDYDASTQEYGSVILAMPNSWDAGTITAQFYWMHPSTATNFAVVWGMNCASLTDGDGYDTQQGTGVTVTDTGGTTQDVYISAATSGITCSNTPAAGDMLALTVYRAAANGSDTLAVDAELAGILITYQTTQNNDD